MQVTILQTCKATEDGFRLREFKEGETYDLADNCARFLINEGKAKRSVTSELMDVAAAFNANSQAMAQNFNKIIGDK